MVQGKGSLPDGKAELEAEELMLTSVTRHHAGVYRCTASNGFGKEDTKVENYVLVKDWQAQQVLVVIKMFLYSTKDNNSTKRGALWRLILKVKVVGYKIPTSPVFTL